jgi:hypothetical protein
MNLTNQQVRFRIRDVYVPDGKELTFQLYADSILRGRVVDASDNEEPGGHYAVVEVDGLDAPVVVPVARLIQERKSLFDEKINNSCNAKSPIERKVL